MQQQIQQQQQRHQQPAKKRRYDNHKIKCSLCCERRNAARPSPCGHLLCIGLQEGKTGRAKQERPCSHRNTHEAKARRQQSIKHKNGRKKIKSNRSSERGSRVKTPPFSNGGNFQGGPFLNSGRRTIPKMAFCPQGGLLLPRRIRFWYLSC